MENSMIRPADASNFKCMQRAFKSQDVAIVNVKDAKGKEYQAICILHWDDDTEEYVYTPFGFMLTTNFYSFMGRMIPPKELKGRWEWDPSNKTDWE